MRLAVVVVVFLSSSCDVLRPGPEVVCDEVQLGGMRCGEVVDVAGTQLAEVGKITRLTVSRGVPCPIDEAVSCPHTPPGAVSTVYADLADGRLVAVPVYAADGDGSLRAGALQEMDPAP